LRSGRLIGTGALAAALFAGGAAGWNVWTHGESQTSAAPPDAPVQRDTATASALSRAFRQAAQQALVGVVYIQVRGVRSSTNRAGAPRAPNGGRPVEGSGSGFFFRPDGYILTNNHVVEGARRVTVVLQDRREFDAEVIGRDPNTDIAVLKIEGDNLPKSALGDSDVLQVGDWVVALGYPLQLGSTATAGIVSALGRSIGILQQSEEASAPLEFFIQTDAAINPGNSGGPLVDLRGRVVGVSSAIASPTGFYSGYGFAIPINLAARVASDLIRYGEVHRPQLGVSIDDVDPADAEIYGLARPEGVEVIQVAAGSPAERAGVELGDVITGVDGTSVAGSGALMDLLARKEPGRVVKLSVVRFGNALDMDVELGEFEPAVRVSQLPTAGQEPGLGRLGFAAADLTPALAASFGIDPTSGVVISQIDPSGAAARAQLAPGSVLERFNGEPIGTVDDLRRATRDLRAGQAVSLVVRTRFGIRTIINYRVRS
jgi:serine protease Do